MFSCVYGGIALAQVWVLSAPPRQSYNDGQARGGTSVGTPRPVAVLLLIFIFLLPLLSLRQTYWRKIHLGLRPVVDARRGGGHRLAGLLEGCLVALLCSHLHREALLPRQPGDRGRRRV